MAKTVDSPLAGEVERLAALGPKSLADRRRAAFDAYLAAPLPDRALHLWRYTDPARLLPEGFRAGDAETGARCEGADQEGVNCSGFGAYLESGAARGRFATLSNEGGGKFEALHLAAFSGGFV